MEEKNLDERAEEEEPLILIAQKSVSQQRWFLGSGILSVLFVALSVWLAVQGKNFGIALATIFAIASFLFFLFAFRMFHRPGALAARQGDLLHVWCRDFYRTFPISSLVDVRHFREYSRFLNFSFGIIDLNFLDAGPVRLYGVKDVVAAYLVLKEIETEARMMRAQIEPEPSGTED